MAGKIAVFIDRDGVINENREDYVTAASQFRFIPGALDALVHLATSPFPIVVVTNQAAVGRGLMSQSVLGEIHALMTHQVEAAGGRIDGIFTCIHRPEDGCTCRKPHPGMLHQAARELNVALEHSYFVGDSVADVEAARAAGCRPILVLTGHGRAARVELERRGGQCCPVVRSLSEAVSLIWPNGSGQVPVTSRSCGMSGHGQAAGDGTAPGSD